jgi:hypothetical protein
LRIAQSDGPPHQVLCLRRETEPVSENHASLRNYTMGEVPKKIMSVNFIRAMFSVWISLLLNMGLIGCLETSVWNYHSALHNILKERRST